jgi:hypothetical protein
LAGDAIDIAFIIGHNDHPDFGGLELTLQDLKSVTRDPEGIPKQGSSVSGAGSTPG